VVLGTNYTGVPTLLRVTGPFVSQPLPGWRKPRDIMRIVADRQDSDREVLTSLPRSRPVRRSTKRAARPDAVETTAPKATTAARPRAKAKPKAAAPTAPKPRAAATPKAARRSARPPRQTPAAARAPRPPRKVPPAGYAAPTSNAGPDESSAVTDLIGTTVQAATELAQIGVAVGRLTLRSLVERLPKP
jgi:hypothetical protein